MALDYNIRPEETKELVKILTHTNKHSHRNTEMSKRRMEMNKSWKLHYHWRKNSISYVMGKKENSMQVRINMTST